MANWLNPFILIGYIEVQIKYQNYNKVIWIIYL